MRGALLVVTALYGFSGWVLGSVASTPERAVGEPSLPPSTQGPAFAGSVSGAALSRALAQSAAPAPAPQTRESADAQPRTVHSQSVKKVESGTCASARLRQRSRPARSTPAPLGS